MRARLLGPTANPLVQDVTLAAGLWIVTVLLSLITPAELQPPQAQQLPFELVAMAIVAIRRRWTWAAAILLSAHTMAPFLIGHVTTSVIGLVVVSYTVAAYLRLRQAIAASILLWAPGLALAVLSNRASGGALMLPPVYFITFNALVALVLFFVGRTMANRRAYVRALEDRARSAEHNNAAMAAQAVADERRRIARELHDMVAHHVSVMSVLATGSRRMLGRDPAAAEDALKTIEETGRTVLREMGRLLTVLRSDAEPAGEMEPQPGLAGVEALVEQVREAGLSTTLTIEGTPTQPLDPGLALTVYRIVQEALTNALKHAGPADVAVALRFGTQQVNVEILDTGRGPPLGAPATGHGLLGMRERITLYGGTLYAGPRRGGGYRVYATIPLDATDCPRRREQERAAATRSGSSHEPVPSRTAADATAQHEGVIDERA